jgi:hypothetical protein
MKVFLRAVPLVSHNKALGGGGSAHDWCAPTTNWDKGVNSVEGLPRSTIWSSQS